MEPFRLASHHLEEVTREKVEAVDAAENSMNELKASVTKG